MENETKFGRLDTDRQRWQNQRVIRQVSAASWSVVHGGFASGPWLVCLCSFFPLLCHSLFLESNEVSRCCF
jgi:hypothetical protein